MLKQPCACSSNAANCGGSSHQRLLVLPKAIVFRDRLRIRLRVTQRTLVIASIRWIVPAVWLLAPSDLDGSVGTDASRASLKVVQEWVRDTGAETVIRGNILRPMGLPAADLHVRERGFRRSNEVLTHVCAVPTSGFDESVFFAATDEADGSAIVWRASVAGELLSTVRFAGGVAIRVSDAEFKDAFNTERAFFVEQASAANSRVNESPSAMSRQTQPVTRQPNNVSSNPARAFPRHDRLVIATHPWIVPVVIGFLIYAARPIKRRG